MRMLLSGMILFVVDNTPDAYCIRGELAAMMIATAGFSWWAGTLGLWGFIGWSAASLFFAYIPAFIFSFELPDIDYYG